MNQYEIIATMQIIKSTVSW